MNELQLARVALCDLLIGREFRARAAESLLHALIWESAGVPSMAAEALDQAVHRERIAVWAERGAILFGGRFNRCGYQPRCESKGDRDP